MYHSFNEKAHKMGYEAAIAKKDTDYNPFDPEEQESDHNDWRIGYQLGLSKRHFGGEEIEAI